MTESRHDSLGDLLGIAIVTHNMGLRLEHTLRQLSESPLSSARITVFDNCSSDASLNVCLQHSTLLPLLRVVRYGKDIGADAACLHAVEILNDQYGWVLCGDASYDFSFDPDLIKSMQCNEFSAIYVGSRTELGWSGAVTCDIAQLVANGSRIHASFSPWPSLIFRTSLFDEECLVRGYRLVNNIYSNFPFLNALVDSNAKVYVAQHQYVMLKEGGCKMFTDLYRFAAWVNCCQSIKSISLREMTIYDSTVSGSFLSAVSSGIAVVDDFGSKKFWNAVIDIVWGTPPRQRRMLLILCMLMIAPVPRSWRQALSGWIAARAVKAVGTAA